MKKYLLLPILFVSFLSFAQCVPSDRYDGLLFFVAPNYTEQSLQFNLVGNSQRAFLNQAFGDGYLYNQSVRRLDSNTINNTITFDGNFRIKKVSIQFINQKCLQVIEVEKYRMLSVSTNINWTFTVDSQKIVTPGNLKVSDKDSKTFQTNIEGHKYSFRLNVKDLLGKKHKIIDHTEDDIKANIITTMRLGYLAALVVNAKKMRINNISYQISE
jgi:hypothetical protein